MQVWTCWSIGMQGSTEFGRGLALLGGQQRAQEPVVQLGVEDATLIPSGVRTRL